VLRYHAQHKVMLKFDDGAQHGVLKMLYTVGFGRFGQMKCGPQGLQN
jgi:hypothetical protein